MNLYVNAVNTLIAHEEDRAGRSVPVRATR
jgi:hypothetical protein